MDNQQLNITFLLTQSLESPGGSGRYFPLAKALTELGHQVTIIALHHDYKNAHKRYYVQDGVTVHYVGQMHVRKVNNEKIYYGTLGLLWITAVSSLRLTWATLKTPSDIVHVCKTQPMNGVAAWVSHKLQHTPVFLDSDDYEAVNNRFGGKWQQRIVAWFEDWLPTFATGITVNTTFIGKRFQEMGYPSSQIALVPNGVDRATFAMLNRADTPDRLAKIHAKLQLNTEHKTVVYVGSMSLTSHAIDLLLESFVDVVKQMPSVILLLVGAGEDFSYLQKLAENLQLMENVRFVGKVPSSETPFYYALGDVTVDPMRNSIQAKSSLSLKLVESIAAGTPCITSDIGDRKQVAGNAGLAVLPDNAKALSTGILSVLQHPEIAVKMRESAKERREAQWWDVRVRTFTSVYPQA
jgi:glycosyltransferase involved in cell wall biosynthesis